MKKQIKFINPVTYSQIVVDVGIAGIMFLGALSLGFFQIYSLFDAEHLVNWRYVLLISVALHLLHFRFFIRGPFVATSIILSCLSNGVTLFASSFLINRFVAEALRNSGWKVSDKDGNFGEYSSRFLAMEEYHFQEGDIMNSKNDRKRDGAH